MNPVRTSLRALGRFPLAPSLIGLVYLVVPGIAGSTQISEVLRPALIMIALQALALVVLYRIASHVRATLIVFGITLWLIPWTSSVSGLALIVLSLIAVVMLGRLGRPVRADALTIGVLNVITAFILVVVLGNLLISTRLGIGPTAAAAPVDCLTTNDAARPNIYMFLLDSHARQDTLTRLYDYDGTTWLKDLEAEGFLVDPTAYSNYARTEWTLASMFNLVPAQEQSGVQAYLDAGQPLYSASIRDALKRSRVDQLLACAGYEIVATGMPMSQLARDAGDSYIDRGQINSYEINILQETRLAAVIDVLRPGWFDEQHRDRLETAMDDAVELSSQPGERPRFTWIHMLSPHMPPVWSGDGVYPPSPISLSRSYFADNATERGETPEQYVAAYRAGLDRLHARMLETVRAIAANDPTGVIIIFSDHGPGSQLREALDKSDLAERFGILFAARTPGRIDVFSDSPITPLKVFPRLFNAYLGTDLVESDESEMAWFGPLPPVGRNPSELVRVDPFGSPAP